MWPYLRTGTFCSGCCHSWTLFKDNHNTGFSLSSFSQPAYNFARCQRWTNSCAKSLLHTSLRNWKVRIWQIYQLKYSYLLAQKWSVYLSFMDTGKQQKFITNISHWIYISVNYSLRSHCFKRLTWSMRGKNVLIKDISI